MSASGEPQGLPGEDWTRPQVEAAVASYKKMLLLELQGKSYNKKQFNRELQSIIGRSPGSIEQKHHNTSSVLRDLGLPYIFGYKPKGNRQKLLENVVEEVIAADPLLIALVEAAVERLDFSDAAPLLDLQLMWVRAPEPEKSMYAAVGEAPGRGQLRLGKNYLEIEARNHALGLAGEELVLKMEHQRLWMAGEKKLAERIEHVSQTRGDGLGYDVLSFEEDGRERFIEVKTTQFGALTPFFVTRNEVAVSEAEASRYQVYRLFSFTKQPRVFALSGALGRSCRLEPNIYTAFPR